MYTPIISVIVPVYNVEPYLRECIDSILNQLFCQFELILVNDGSTDNCGAICDDYSAKDGRIVVIHKENGGLSSARNAALDIIRGKYITFIDSDDVVAPNYLSELYYAIINEKADVSICSMLTFVDTNIDSSCCGTPAQFISLSGRDAIAYRYSGKLSIACCGKLIDSRMIEEYRFPVGKIHEDQAIMPFIIYESRTVAITQAKLYFYRIRKGSITGTSFSLKHFDNIEFMNLFIEYLHDAKDGEILALAKKHRDNVLAEYNILAKTHGLTIPSKYRMREERALFLFRKANTYNRFIWYLSKLHPRMVRVYDYCNRLELFFKGKPL